MRRSLLTLLMLGLMLAGCGTNETPSPTTAPATPATGAATPTTGQASDAPEQVALAALASQLGLQPSDLQVGTIEKKEWANGSLDCPDIATTYMQMITPGYQMTFTAAGTTYDVRATEDMSYVVLCMGGSPIILDPTASGSGAMPDGEGAMNDEAQVVAQVQQALAQELGVKLDSMKLVSTEFVEWPSSALGCPKPGEMYMTVITPGYKVIVEHEGQQYEVHTDLTGNSVRCATK